MSELNAEQVKKALECCTLEGCHDCRECPQCNVLLSLCKKNAMADALALINSQEQRIKELTEDLHATRTELTKKLHECKADTVRKMQERLNREALIDRGYEVLLEGTIDQIAKEMLESGDG